MLLCNAVSELEKGEPSELTNQFINSLSREVDPPVDENIVKLFARNLDVDLYNYEQLETIHAYPLHIFNATDEGDTHYLNKMLAPKHLGIKVSVPVMLLMNLNDKLVNGLIGTVTNIEQNKISVTFTLDGKNENS